MCANVCRRAGMFPFFSSFFLSSQFGFFLLLLALYLFDGAVQELDAARKQRNFAARAAAATADADV